MWIARTILIIALGFTIFALLGSARGIAAGIILPLLALSCWNRRMRLSGAWLEVNLFRHRVWVLAFLVAAAFVVRLAYMLMLDGGLRTVQLADDISH